VQREDWGRVLDVLAINYVATTMTCPVRYVDGTGYNRARGRAIVAIHWNDPYAKQLGSRVLAALAAL
jgi:hypothetical protein